MLSRGRVSLCSLILGALALARAGAWPPESTPGEAAAVLPYAGRQHSRPAAHLGPMGGRSLMQAGAGLEPAALQCFSQHCLAQLGKCMEDAGCVQTQQCMVSCPAGNINCADGCLFQHATEAFIDTALCAESSGCPLPAAVAQAFNQTCPDWSGRPLARGFNVTMLAQYGTLYPVRAIAYDDCLPCQRAEYEPLNSSAVQVQWSEFGSGVTNKTVTYVILQDGEGQGVSQYSVLGLPLSERHYFLDTTLDFLLLFYCGSVLGGHYLGSAVYSTERGAALPADVAARFARVLEDANLEGYIPPFDKFCVPEYPVGCPA